MRAYFLSHWTRLRDAEDRKVNGRLLPQGIWSNGYVSYIHCIHLYIHETHSFVHYIHLYSYIHMIVI